MQNVRLLKIAALLFAVLALNSCRKQAGTRESSSTKQISHTDFECRVADASRTQILDSAPELFQGFNPTSLAAARGLVGNLPEPYIRHLITSMQMSQFRITFKELVTSCAYTDAQGNEIIDNSPNGTYAGVGGCTSVAFYPTFAHVKSGQVNFALIHELGHGLRDYVWQKGSPNGDSTALKTEWNRLYEEEGQNNYIRDYSRIYTDKDGNVHKSYDEYWADAFQSFYCSPEANDGLRQNLTKTHQFLSMNLLPPAWESPAPVGGSGSAAASPFPSDAGYSTGTVFVKLLSNPYGSADRFMVTTPMYYNSAQLCIGTTPTACSPSIATTSVSTAGQTMNIQLMPSRQMGPYGTRLWQGSITSALQTMQQAAFSTGGMLYGVARGTDGVTTGRMNFYIRSRY